MSFIDIFIGIILIVAGYRGYKNGLLLELSSILSLLLGVMGSVLYSSYIESILRNTVGWNGHYTGIVSVVITFILIVLIIYILARLASSLLDLIALGLINRLAGVIFSLVKTAFILSVALLIVAQIEKHSKILPDSAKEKSVLYSPVKQFAPNILPFFHVKEFAQRFKDL